MLPRFDYVRPSTLAEALSALGAPGARVHAGGTDLLGCLRDEVFGAASVVSLASLPELKGIGKTPDGGLRIGATATLAEVARHPEVVGRYPVLAQAALAAASPQLRNQGTLGGNLCQRPRCWYFRADFDCARKDGEICYAENGENELHAIFGGSGCHIVHPSDTAPALVALDAVALLASPKGTRKVPLADFFVLPAVDHKRETVLAAGEVLTEVLLPRPPAGARGSYRKARTRGAWDFALAGLASWLAVEGGVVRRARLVLSGVAPVPWRVRAAEEAITGKALGPSPARSAAEAAVAGAKPLAKNAYKVDLVRGVVEEALLALA